MGIGRGPHELGRSEVSSCSACQFNIDGPIWPETREQSNAEGPTIASASTCNPAR